MSNTNETNKTRFWFQLKSYGISKLILSVDFLVALAVFISIVIDNSYGLGIFLKSQNSYIITIFAAASTLFAITLATLAILLSFSSSSLMSFLKQKDKFSSILFLFWIGNASYLVVVFLSLIYLTIDISKIDILDKYLYPSIVAVFVYSLINTLYLLGTIIRFGYFLEIYDRINGTKD